MAGGGPKFADLLPRVLSALVLLGIAGAGLWLGGLVLALLLSVVGAVMFWEYFRLIIRLTRPFALIATALASILLAAALILEDRMTTGDPVLAMAPAALWVLAGTVAVVVLVVRKSRLETAFGAMIPVATFLFFFLHQSVPVGMWLVVATVIAVDVAGYFFGKLIGGPKFWPALSPNKTWAGTVSGWICAAVIAVAVGMRAEETSTVVLGVIFLVGVAFAAQLADIAESALKRRAGVKDSSNLLPGHGGLLDRFDGMLGGFLVAGAAFALAGFALVPV